LLYGWVNDCGKKKAATEYCQCVGKNISHSKNRQPVGEITGVSWRPIGSLIEGKKAADAARAAGLPPRTSQKDAFYYIIDDGTKLPPFLKDPDETLFGNGSIKFYK
jgi:hypothetical protein